MKLLKKLIWSKDRFKKIDNLFEWTESRKNFQTSPFTFLVRTMFLVPAQQKETKTHLAFRKGIPEYICQ